MREHLRDAAERAGDPLDAASRAGARGELLLERIDERGRRPAARRLEPLPQPRDALREPLALDGLEQVVERALLEGVQRVLLVRRREHHVRVARSPRARPRARSRPACGCRGTRSAAAVASALPAPRARRRTPRRSPARGHSSAQQLAQLSALRALVFGDECGRTGHARASANGNAHRRDDAAARLAASDSDARSPKRAASCARTFESPTPSLSPARRPSPSSSTLTERRCPSPQPSSSARIHDVCRRRASARCRA